MEEEAPAPAAAGDGTKTEMTVGPYVVTQVKQDCQTKTFNSNVEKPSNPQIQIQIKSTEAAVAAVQTTLKKKAEQERRSSEGNHGKGELIRNTSTRTMRRTTTTTSEDSEVSSSSLSLVSESDPDLHPCKICLSKFSSSSQLTKHVIQHKVGDNEGKYECINCFEIFDKKHKFLEHKKNACLSLVSPSRVFIVE